MNFPHSPTIGFSARYYVMSSQDSLVELEHGTNFGKSERNYLYAPRSPLLKP